MKLFHLGLVAVLLAGCGQKKVPDAAAKPPKEAPAEEASDAEAVTADREEPGVTAERAEPEPEPELPSNADFNATITHADGSTAKGHVKRVERSEGWYGEKGWTDKAVKLTVTLEGNGTEIEAEWKDIKTVGVKYGSVDDIDCQFDSEYTPIMYMCVLKSTGTVSHADGKTWTAGSRHKWRFTFNDGRVEEFWIKKLPEREQEAGNAEIGDGSEQNFALYEKLQKRVAEKARTSAVTKIEITP